VNKTNILNIAGDAASSATDAEFELLVSIASDQGDALELAGTYTDTITLTYTDL